MFQQGGVNMPYGQRSNEHYERQLRSVFVGNIPYNSTEEDIKRVFETVGPVVSFKYVMDRETGKPKGFGFIEYGDQAMAESAVRNLTGQELNGRVLRIDSAANQQHRQPGGGPQNMGDAGANQEPAPSQPIQQVVESPYGEECAPEKAPEAITQAVASLPPEQMFELMKQMKACIQNNAHEARNMLLTNPQLAYALLQAQVVMRLVDPQVAISMLHNPSSEPNVNPLPSQPVVSAAPMGVPHQQHAPPVQMSREEQERADLIRQVVGLTEEQIALLPPDHRQSVMALRQQLRQQGQM